MTLSNGTALSLSPTVLAPPPLLSPLSDAELLALLRPLMHRDLSAVIPPAVWRALWNRVRFPAVAAIAAVAAVAAGASVDEPLGDLSGCWTWRSLRASRAGSRGAVCALQLEIPRSDRLGGGTAGTASAHARRVAWEYLGWGSTATLSLMSDRERCGNERCLRPDHAASHERKRGRWPGVLELMGLEEPGTPSIRPAQPSSRIPLHAPTAPLAPGVPASAQEVQREVQVVGPFRSGECIAFTPYGTFHGSMLSVCAEVEARSLVKERAR